MASRFQIKRESLENVIETLQCYNCKSVPGLGEGEKDRFSCFNESHQLCKDCKNRCKCGSEVGKNPNPILRKMLEDSPMYCPRYKTGCRQVFLKTENLEDHRKECVFRPVYCPVVICEQKVLFLNITEHLTSHHFHLLEKAKASTYIAYVANKKCLINLPLANKPCKYAYIFPRKIDLIDGVDFYLVGKLGSNIMYAWIYIVGSPLEAKSYAYTMSITGKIRDKFTYHGFVKPLDEGPDDIIAKQLVFMIGVEAMKELKDENGNLKIDVTIHALKEEAKDMDIESGVEDESE